MNRDNQPTYNVNRNIVNFKDFNIEDEEEELLKIKRGTTPNSERQQVIGNQKYKFNKVTRKMDEISPDMIDDELDSLEEGISNKHILKFNEGFFGNIFNAFKDKLNISAEAIQNAMSSMFYRKHKEEIESVDGSEIESFLSKNGLNMEELSEETEGMTPEEIYSLLQREFVMERALTAKAIILALAILLSSCAANNYNYHKKSGTQRSGKHNNTCGYGRQPGGSGSYKQPPR